MYHVFFIIISLLWAGDFQLSATLPGEGDKNISSSYKPVSLALKEEEHAPVSPHNSPAFNFELEQKAPLDIDAPFLPTDSSKQSVNWGMNQSQVEYLFEHSLDFILIREFDKLKRINAKRFQEVLGWSEKEILDFPLKFFMHPEEIKTDYDRLRQQRLFKSGYEARFKCKDSSYRWIQWMTLEKLGMPLEEINDNRLVLSIGRDITQQKEQEAERRRIIEESQKKITLLKNNFQSKNQVLKALSDIQSVYFDKGASYHDQVEEDSSSTHYRPLGKILEHFIELSESEYGFIGEISCNKDQLFLREIFARRNKEATDKRLDQFTSFIKQKDRRIYNFDNILSEIIANGTPIIINDFKAYPKSTITPLGDLPITSFLGIPLTSGADLVGTIILANKDKGYSKELTLWLEPLSRVAGHILNELKIENCHKEAQRQEITRKQAEAANEAKSSFLAHMSHEIRTPLTGILGLLDLIRGENLSEEDREYLKNAQMAGMALMSLLNDILDASKIEAHQVGLEKIELNPVQITHELIQIFSMEAKEHETSLTVSSAVPHCLIGDPMRLRQILSNLISNAVKFTTKGFVHVTLKGQENSEKDGFLLRGIVTDTGIGMAPDTVSQLFQPFMQADKSIMRQYGGSGLGLFITKSLCELMEGEIKVMSQLGMGSTFQFTVKMGLPKAKGLVTIDQAERLTTLKNIRILIAEDNLINQKVLKAILQREGCSSITVTSNGQEAWEAVQKEHYDIILMDGEMPVMDGLEATRKIRQHFNNQTLPIIGVTAHALATNRKQFLEAGMDGYLTKPIHREALKGEILRLLEGGPLTVQLPS